MRKIYADEPARFRAPAWAVAPGALTVAWICVIVFLAQRVLMVVPSLDRLFPTVFGLSRHTLFRGFLWQPVTYIFLHGSFFHLLVNMLVVVLFGSGFEQSVGTRRFWMVFLVSGIVGGLGWLLITPNPYAICVGASGGVFGLIGAYAGLFPRRRVTVFLFFVLPITLQARMLAFFLGLSTLLDMLFGRGGQVAHAAHLFGGIAGYYYGRRLLAQVKPSARARRMGFRMKRPPSWRPRFFAGGAMVDPDGEDDDGMPDLDDLLDKINRHGLRSLTPMERRALHDYARRGLDGRGGPRGEF